MHTLRFLCLTGAIAACPVPVAAQSAATPVVIGVDTLAPGVVRLRRSGAGQANVLLVSGTTASLLVDSDRQTSTEALLATLDALGAPAVRWVVSTHYHWDHLGANPELRARGAELVGQAGLPALARVDTTIAELSWHREPARPEAIPTVAFTDSTVLQPGGRTVRIFHLPAAHTGADAAVWIPDADVLHLGDVYELDAFPFVDWWAGGTFDGIVAAVDRFLVLAGPRTRVVPGHGPVSDRAELERYGAMLREARRLVREARAAGQSEAALLDAAPWRDLPPGRWGSERSARQFFQQLYRHLPR